ncbi:MULTISPECIES: DUF4376 domain-containing protein [Salmonella]|uniref:DUF4376 domain-containing protein n=1 Tax=Salmonella TaxID=590 RepID=UPI0035267D92
MADLATALGQKYAEINAWRNAQENGNYPFTLNDHHWDCGKASQDRLSPVTAVANRERYHQDSSGRMQITSMCQ